MLSSHPPYDVATMALITAALDTAWVIARYQFPDLSLEDRVNMEKAVLGSVALCERDFMRLQWHALTIVGAYAAAPMERRQKPRLVVTNDAPVDRRNRTQF